MTIAVNPESISIQASQIQAEGTTPQPSSTAPFSMDDDLAVKIGNLSSFKEEHPRMFRGLMRFLQNGILSQLRRQHRHEQEVLKEARRRG